MSYEPFELVKPKSNTLSNIRVYPGLTSATIIWDVPQQEFEDYYVVVAGDDKVETYVHNDNTFYIRSGLTPNTVYNVEIYSRNGEDYNLEYTTSFTTAIGDPIEEEQEEQDVCTMCEDNDGCIPCEGTPFCFDGRCFDCDPSQQIGTNSRCYSKKHVCVDNSGTPACGLCNSDPANTDELCKTGYGDGYKCNLETGECIVPPSPTPDAPKSYLRPILVISGVVGMILLVLILMIIYFSGTRRE